MKKLLMAAALAVALATPACAEPLDDLSANGSKLMKQARAEYAKAERLCRSNACRDGLAVIRGSFAKMKENLLEGAEDVMTLVTGERDGLIAELDNEMAKAEIAFLKSSTKGGKAWNGKLGAGLGSLCDSGTAHDAECRHFLGKAAEAATAGGIAAEKLGSPFKSAQERHIEACDYVFSKYIAFLKMLLEQKNPRFSDGGF